MKILNVFGISVLLMTLLLLPGCRNSPGESWIPESPESPAPELEEPLVFKSRQDDFQITATNRWMEDVTLHGDSILSLGSEAYDSYLILLKDSKSSFPRDIHLAYYAELTGEATLVTLDNGEITELEDVEIASYPGKRFYVRGGIDGVAITYLFYVFEEEDSFLQLVAWSSSANMERNQAYYNGILSSLARIEPESPEDPEEAETPLSPEEPIQGEETP